jgi:hypothetical protein
VSASKATIEKGTDLEKRMVGSVSGRLVRRIDTGRGIAVKECIARAEHREWI